jgi:hypothetical protein
MSKRKIMRAVLSEISAGVDHSIRYGRHVRLRLEANGRHETLTFSLTPSDVNAIRNMRKDVQQACARLTTEV